jgi:hypothetical protein
MIGSPDPFSDTVPARMTPDFEDSFAETAVAAIKDTTTDRIFIRNLRIVRFIQGQIQANLQISTH